MTVPSNYYVIPDDCFFRLHHVRPRFKNNVEEVLLYVATAISDSPVLSHYEFKERLNSIIKAFVGNSNLKDKTIQNWRTEISALFSFVQQDAEKYYPSLMAKRLAENRYLDEFFNYFLLTFQYPSGGIKSHQVVKMISADVRFKPCPFILDVLIEGAKILNKSFSLSAEEIAFCAFYDLRVIRGKKTASDVALQIIDNRKNKLDYFFDYDLLKSEQGILPSKGDIIRYAADIMDYMVLAGLLKSSQSLYYKLNAENNMAINKHLEFKSVFFAGYNDYYSSDFIRPSQIGALESDWFDYVNSFDGISEFLPRLTSQQSIDISNLVQDYYERMNSPTKVSTKVIGDYGEMLIFAHEYLRTKEKSNRQHLIQKIPTPLSVGYDLQSIEEEKGKRYIEVKTTTSKKAINFNTFKLTPNEWDTAETLRDRYFIYYLVIVGDKKSIFIIQDPVGKYHERVIDIDDGLIVRFSSQKFQPVELLEVCR